VDVGEPALGNVDWEGFDMDMLVDFGLLALCAVFGPSGDVSIDSCPNKLGTQKSLIPAQTNLEHKSRFVASLPGCAMLWMLLKTARR
jgi:hypothetical protein